MYLWRSRSISAFLGINQSNITHTHTKRKSHCFPEKSPKRLHQSADTVGEGVSVVAVIPRQSHFIFCDDSDNTPKCLKFGRNLSLHHSACVRAHPSTWTDLTKTIAMAHRVRVQQEKNKAKRSIFSGSPLQLVATMPSEGKCWVQEVGEMGRRRGHHLLPIFGCSWLVSSAIWKWKA